jgi:hypothetical protein
MKNNFERIYLIIFILIFPALLLSQSKKENTQEKILGKFTGSWCDMDNTNIKDSFQLFFSQNLKGKTEISYQTGGPFYTYLSARINSEHEIELYFDYLDATPAFYKVSGHEKLSVKYDCSRKVATVKMLHFNKIKINTYQNQCAYIPQDIELILYKLNEDEYCEI